MTGYLLPMISGRGCFKILTGRTSCAGNIVNDLDLIGCTGRFAQKSGTARATKSLVVRLNECNGQKLRWLMYWNQEFRDASKEIKHADGSRAEADEDLVAPWRVGRNRPGGRNA